MTDITLPSHEMITRKSTIIILIICHILFGLILLAASNEGLPSRFGF